MSGFGVMHNQAHRGLIAPGQRNILLLLLEIYNAITLGGSATEAMLPLSPSCNGR
jgi:hypothetical protein